MSFDLPDTVNGLEDRIQLLEKAEETASREVYEHLIKPELDAAYTKKHRLQLQQLRAEAAAPERPPLRQAA